MERENTFSLTFPLLVFFVILHSCWFYQVVGNGTPATTPINRETLEIVIGVGSPPYSPAYPPDNGECQDCPQPPMQPPCPPPPSPPPPPPCPPPPPPFTLSEELKMAIQVIQRFKRRIKCDPFGVTKTWTGNRICYDKSKYKGFVCDRSTKDNKFRVVGVNFNGFNFNGGPGCPLVATDFVEDLKDLVIFHVNSNNFTGDIPFGISKLPNFFEFDLSNNKLVGAFPAAALGATNLTYLDVRFNQLTGTIPPQAFTLDLDVLFLNNNAFSGKIPHNLGQTPVLYLTFANNELTGPIPKSIGQTSRNLLEVLFLNNSLSGCLPYEIGFLNKTHIVDVSINQLTGPIPQSFGCLKDIQQLNLSYNQFYGAVPESLCILGDLEVLDLKFNYFTQVGPECWKLIEKKVLNVTMNCILDLPSQRSPEECEAFFSRRWTCPDPKWLNYVPCGIYVSKGTPQTSDHVPKRARPPSPTYAALKEPGS
ncbi:uncharacterized protein At4g06744-like [Coffea arabica]|uniref:Uncharacterized protein At4g06744-like n=1 Tax=Coffea arabica TaxID=13443 RepID=A0A6P6TNQ3_COFAR|nr:uncharacterized protein At4g06744-like [Coffea arabica]